jgi:hypothetical protein
METRDEFYEMARASIAQQESMSDRAMRAAWDAFLDEMRAHHGGFDFDGLMASDIFDAARADLRTGARPDDPVRQPMTQPETTIDAGGAWPAA